MCEVPGFLPPTMELARGWFLLLCMPPLFFEATLLDSIDKQKAEIPWLEFDCFEDYLPWLDMDPFPVILL